MPEAASQFKVILNLSKYHREHEKFYSQSPLANAIQLHQASCLLKALADHWSEVEAEPPVEGNPYQGCEDLNETALIQQMGVLFLEGEGEPVEITRLKRNLATLADDYQETGRWLGEAMEASWKAALPLAANPELAPVLGERHRIIANDWQAANLSTLIARLVRRALEILDPMDFSPPSVRADLAGPRFFANYLYSSSELLDRAADIAAESAVLVHDNERRWRVFRASVQALAETTGPIQTARRSSQQEPLAQAAG